MPSTMQEVMYASNDIRSDDITCFVPAILPGLPDVLSFLLPIIRENSLW